MCDDENVYENVFLARKTAIKYLGLIKEDPERYFCQRIHPAEIQEIMLSIYYNDQQKAFFGSAGILTYPDLVKKLADIGEYPKVEKELESLLQLY